MPEDVFEPAACPDPEGIIRNDIVTDEEFRSWVKRSQRHTDAVMREWDSGAHPEQWDDDVEFYEEDDELIDATTRRRSQREAMRRERRALRQQDHIDSVDPCHHAHVTLLVYVHRLEHSEVSLRCRECGHDFIHIMVDQIDVHHDPPFPPPMPHGY